MNRVWKKFLLKIGKAFAIVTLAISGIILILVSMLWLGVHPNIALPVTMFFSIILPMFGYILRQVYIDCKEEVEIENKKILRDIRGF